MIFVLRYVAAGLGFVWRLVLDAQTSLGSPVERRCEALMFELRSPGQADWPLKRLLSWFPATPCHVIMVLLAIGLCTGIQDPMMGLATDAAWLVLPVVILGTISFSIGFVGFHIALSRNIGDPRDTGAANRHSYDGCAA